MASSGGREGRQHGSGGAVCSRLAPWRIGWETVIGILVVPGKKGNEKKEETRIGYFKIYGHSFLE